ncbi:lipase maturation factor 2-like [Phytophthora cinnamomi]|uniref:lipase maturation factor 2-like n=1 Tax=Phytophthora cinnamomi TaxID=4785 RepID=UPI00355A469F|nr:lipase maturation factor 2-like [Phytophthora cinnamomi]
MLRFPRERFLICICGVYAVAFASIRTQVRGLYGEEGIEPVDAFLRSVKRRLYLCHPLGTRYRPRRLLIALP